MKKTFSSKIKSLISLAIVIIICFSSFAVTSTASTSNDISSKLSDVKISLYSGSSPIIVDNVPVGTPTLSNWTQVELSISWKLAESVFSGQAKEGDFFEIAIPHSYFSFNIVDQQIPLKDESNVTLGYWDVKSKKPIHFVLSKEGAEKTSLEGTFRFYGQAVSFTDTTISLAFGDVIIEVPIKPATQAQQGSGFPYQKSAEAEKDPASKSGAQAQKGGKSFDWHITVNMDNFVNVVENKEFNSLKNAFVYDCLSDDQLMQSITISSLIRRPRSDGTPTVQYGSSINLTTQFEKITQTAGQTNAQFISYVKALNRPAYGITSDKKEFAVCLGSVPGNGVKYGTNDADFRSKLWSALSEEEKDTIIATYGEHNSVGGQVMNYYITVRTTVTGKYSSYSNTATFGYDGGSKNATYNGAIFYDVDGSIKGTDPTRLHDLGWMRSSELQDASFLKSVGTENDAWTYEEAFAATPLRYFENEDVRSVANTKSAAGTEITDSADEQLVGLEHIWDRGSYFDTYKTQNGDAPYGWASWKHWGISGNVKDKGQYSIRRFSTYFEMNKSSLQGLKSCLLAPEDELGNVSYLFPVNDNIFVFVNGRLAFWGGTDVIAGKNQYEALNRTYFMGMEGIKVRNGINSVFKNVYPHTDGWCIDLDENRADVDIKSFLVEGFNRVDIFVDDYWEGGGMNQVKLYTEYAAQQ